MDRISENLYILCRTLDTHVRYAPQYIHTFELLIPHKHMEVQSYKEIQKIPDKLLWLRRNNGLTQTAVADIAGVTKSVYKDIECGITQHIPVTMMEKLADFYAVPVADFMDEFTQFQLDGQALRIRAYREQLNMERKAFSEHTGVPLSSLREWENGRKAISRKCWERYFKGRA